MVSLIVINHAWSLLLARRSWAVTLLMLGLKAAVSVWTGGGPSAFTVTEWQHVGTHEWQMRIEMRVVSAWIQELATQHVYLLLIGATAWAGQCMQEAARREAFWQTVLLDKAHRELARKAEADVQQARVP